MAQIDPKDAFVHGLRDKWEAQVKEEGSKPSYVFNGWSGDEYNYWLEHRHGWPVTEEGWCGPAWSSRLDDNEPPTEIPYEDCSICSDLVQQYSAQE